MTIKERLMEDFKAAMKAKDQVARDTISFARAAVKQQEIDSRQELSDEGVIAILTKQVKMRKDALADFEKAGRTDLIGFNRKCLISPKKGERPGDSGRSYTAKAGKTAGGKKKTIRNVHRKKTKR